MHPVVREEVPSIGRPLQRSFFLHIFLHGGEVLRDSAEVKAEESGGSPSLKQPLQLFQELKVDVCKLE